MTRMILQLDFPIADKAAKTVAKRANRLQGLAKKRGAKLRLLIPGLILHTSVLRVLDIKTGPIDKKTGQPKYRIFRGKLNDIDPNAKPAKVVAKAVKGAKPAKVVRKVRRARKVKVPAPAAPAANVDTTVAANAPTRITPSLATELADSSAPSSPGQVTHARRSRKLAPAPEAPKATDSNVAPPAQAAQVPPNQP